MNILIFTMGSRGDVQPYVCLGAALRRLGHDVTISTGQGFDEMIEAQGMISAPISLNFRDLIALPEMQDALRSLSGKIRAWRSFGKLIRRHYDDMWAISQAVKPDLFLYHPKGFAAQHIAEAQQVSAVATTLQPAFVPTAEFPLIFLPFPGLGRFGNSLSHKLFAGLMNWGQSSSMKRWRSETLGLKSPYPGDFFAGYDPAGRVLPRLHGYSRHIVPKPADWSAREDITGYWFEEPANDWKPPEALVRFLNTGPPPVYVGFGSMPAEDAEQQTRIVIEALRTVGRRGILATGWGGLKDLPHSENIHMLDAAPHSWLFPHCSTVVHHGGAGTTHEGLRWGRPSVICPLSVDQPYWGRRVMALGAGPAPLPQKRLKAANLAKAIETAHDPAIRTRAEQIGAAIRAEGGADAAAAIIDRFFRNPGDA
jgi:sterol 3beta-glucosyltransferase